MQLANLDLSPKDRVLLESIFAKYINDLEFYAFGSRVVGNNKPYSDLDLAYKVIKENTLYRLKDDLAESDVSITIDFVNMDEISDEFRKHIETNMKKLAN